MRVGQITDDTDDMRRLLLLKLSASSYKTEPNLGVRFNIEANRGARFNIDHDIDIR